MDETQTEQILLIGHGSRDQAAVHECQALADRLSRALQRSVQLCFLEFAHPPIVEGIQACVAGGAKTVVVLPLFLGPGGHQKNDVPAILNWARQRWPHVQFRYGVPLGAQYPLIQALADRAAACLALDPGIPGAETGLLVVGRGSRDPDSNGEVARAARLLFEGREVAWVDYCFFSLATPSVAEGLERCSRLGARRVVVLPYLLFTGRIYRQIQQQVATAQERYPGMRIHCASYLWPHDGVLEALVQRHAEAVNGTASMTCDLCKYRVQMAGFEAEFGLPQYSDHHHGLRGIPHDHGVDPRLARLLPPRYRAGEAVSPAPMGAAPLQFDEEGRVAWDRIWSDFCDLALAGGPPHRGQLLEPVDPTVCTADPAGYARVLAELARGLRLVTGLPVVESATPGWIGLQCESEEMAIWLLRAIVVENVFARREGTVLFLPVGPHFRLAAEIKNVVTVVAKTHHYWQEHIQAMGGEPAP
ncbi:sirohydrochlorin chelatase [Litorilinea aerophila]|uniref:Sirohydrochlorin chelatase n=1 Tax=Litorilinea aerophila TaxID=1204385 RepID=A0A540VJX1_9CHLR|nr:sirohydrochlorin chelatase [Litorilinea aerophila]MCC9075556.1 sirohydrochlorin chelatase [Litorilinea aerophila]